ncbi:hypothetical protein ASD79_08705 [Caulobacter sp. Root655]|uniref:hypothetical protein n=1 Tax=Caulobacter sp. Root655 TaxID=1736578 RepID=UPI000700605A|nr:hypothetical protein [Caulobacter sp. Root655]KRA60304.1 hypothetical protein ASD79_08705 [Caulobacter sp. Root655]
MADLDFEAQLSRLYGQPPVFRDAELFTQRVTQKLDRGWAVRRVVIGATGVVAGLVVAAQLIGGRFVSEFSAVSRDGVQKMDLGLDKVAARYDQLFTLGGTETLWLAAGLAAIALAFAVTRLVDEV